jgi:ABC-type amino acid transport substrate-binding protein
MRIYIKMRYLYPFVLLFCLAGSVFGATHIKIGWLSRLPYSYQINTYGVSQVKGLDIEFIRELARSLKVQITLVPLAEKDLEKAIASKAVDAIIGLPVSSIKQPLSSRSLCCLFVSNL